MLHPRLPIFPGDGGSDRAPNEKSDMSLHRCLRSRIDQAVASEPAVTSDGGAVEVSLRTFDFSKRPGEARQIPCRPLEGLTPSSLAANEWCIGSSETSGLGPPSDGDPNGEVAGVTLPVQHHPGGESLFRALSGIPG